MRRTTLLLLTAAALLLPTNVDGQPTELRRPPVPELRRAPDEAAPLASPRLPVRPPEPSGPFGTTPSTYRDLGAQAIGTIHERVETWSTTKVNRKFKNWLKYDAPPGFNTGAHRECFRQHKRLVKAGERLAGSGAFQILGAVNFASDGGARVAGHLVEFDGRGAVAAGLDEGAKFWVATKGAAAFAKAGVTAGTFFGGPPGAMIGGAVGAVAGAVVATAGYNAFVSPNLSWALGSLGEMVEPDYVEVARQNRAEHLAAIALREKEKELFLEQARQAREDRAAAEQRARERESYIDQARESRREFLEALQAAKAEEAAKPLEAAKPDPPPDASRPVIPADGEIIATCWNVEYPEYKYEMKYHIRDNQVTATLKLPNSDVDGDWTYQYQYSGKLTENRIHGKGLLTITGENRSPDYVYRWVIKSTYEEDVIFHLDGTLQITCTTSNTTSWTYPVKPPGFDAKDGSNSHGPDRYSAAGRWKFADGGAKDNRN